MSGKWGKLVVSTDDVVAHSAKGQAIGFGISSEQGIGIGPKMNADATAFLVANQASA
jgi:hypothetical protein